MGILDTLPKTSFRDKVFAPKIIILGVDGVGKTTNAAAMPMDAYWFVGNDFEIPTSIAYNPATYQPKSYADLLEKLNLIATSKDLDTLRSIVLDNLEHIFTLIDTAVIQQGGNAKTLADFGHGKGYVAQEDKLDDLLNMLDRINDKGVSILINGHTQQQMLVNANGDDYVGNKALIRDKLYKKISAWCNMSGFAYKKAIVNKDKKVTGHIRMIRWETIGSSDGKNRYDLPGEMEFDLGEALKIAENNVIEHRKLIAEIPKLIEKLPTERQVKANLKLQMTFGLENIRSFHEQLIKATTPKEKKGKTNATVS